MINQSLESKNLKDTIGNSLVMQVIKIQIKLNKIAIVIGCLRNFYRTAVHEISSIGKELKYQLELVQRANLIRDDFQCLRNLWKEV